MQVGTLDIAQFVIDTPSNAVPQATLHAVRLSCFDAVGVLLAGSTQPVGGLIQRHVANRGGNPEATVVPSGLRTSLEAAALANGTMMHALDFDDFGAYGHPTAPLLPALLAIGEHVQASGQELLSAYAIGFEVAQSLYKVGNYNQYERGFHSTPVFGCVAAAAGAARLLGLSVDEAAMALGIAASEASGIGRNNGTMTKPFHAGLAARGGVSAALLAQEGWTAAPDIFEAKQGFCETFLGDERYDMQKIVDSLGNPFKAQDNILIKKYPCCASNHSALDAVLSLMLNNNITYADIDRVEVQAMKYTSPVLRYPEPTNGLNAKFSIHHAVGAAIRDRNVTIEHFTDECARDPKMAEARAKVCAEVMSRWDPRFMYGKSDANPVVIHLNDGQSFEQCVGRDELKGSPKNPLSEDELATKFRENALRALQDNEKVGQAIETFLRLDSSQNVGDALIPVCH